MWNITAVETFYIFHKFHQKVKSPNVYESSIEFLSDQKHFVTPL